VALALGDDVFTSSSLLGLGPSQSLLVCVADYVLSELRRTEARAHAPQELIVHAEPRALQAQAPVQAHAQRQQNVFELRVRERCELSVVVKRDMPPTASPSPPLIVGGPLPDGYLYVGAHHQGAPIWASIDTVASSKMDDADLRFPAA